MSGQITGFFNTSGILTHDASADPGGFTAIDSVEASINQLRVASALAEPNLFITSPTTWSAIRRTKATTGQLWKPAILWTDPGSDEEYAERIYPHLPDADDDVEIAIYWLGRTRRTDEWTALTDALVAAGINFVVLDNLMGATGDTNQAGDTTTVFDGLTRLVSRGVPVVVIHQVDTWLT